MDIAPQTPHVLFLGGILTCGLDGQGNSPDQKSSEL